jgi:hypothetical protein
MPDRWKNLRDREHLRGVPVSKRIGTRKVQVFILLPCPADPPAEWEFSVLVTMPSG